MKEKFLFHTLCGRWRNYPSNKGGKVCSIHVLLGANPFSLALFVDVVSGMGCLSPHQLAWLGLWCAGNRLNKEMLSIYSGSMYHEHACAQRSDTEVYKESRNL